MLASSKIPSSLHKSSIDHVLIIGSAGVASPGAVKNTPLGPNSIELDKAEPATSEIGLNAGVKVIGPETF